MFKFLVFWTTTVLLCDLCVGLKLLVVFPCPSRSHAILGEGFVNNLLRAGHEVTYITTDIMKNSSINLRQIDLSENIHLLPVSQFNIETFVRNEMKSIPFTAALSMMFNITKATVLNTEVQKLLHDPRESFDAVLAEWMFSEIYSGFASVYNCPLIWSSSMEPHHMVLSLMDEDPNPAYIADTLSSEVPPFNFWERAYSLYKFFEVKYDKWNQVRNFDSEAYDKAFSAAAVKRGLKLPSLEEARFNGSLLFSNSYPPLGQTGHLPQNIIQIAGYHIGESKPLPEALQRIMDNAKYGVIYFSMGSVLKSKDIPKVITAELLQTFKKMKQAVIWKFEEQLPGVPENVHIVDWAPQQSILAHPNCVLFISHGGLLSTTEAIHFGVPMIGVPMYADQFGNINRAAAKGFAKRVDLDFNFSSKLENAIKDIIESSTYRDRVKELSLIFHERVVPPGTEIVHWVEHVVRTRGAPHLRSPALLLPWYQKLYLDFAALVFVFLCFIIFAIKFIVSSYRKTDTIKLKKI